MNRIKRALWRLVVILVLLVGLPLATLVALLELVLAIGRAVAVETYVWTVEVWVNIVNVTDGAWRSFRAGKRLNGTERF